MICQLTEELFPDVTSLLLLRPRPRLDTLWTWHHVIGVRWWTRSSVCQCFSSVFTDSVLWLLRWWMARPCEGGCLFWWGSLHLEVLAAPGCVAPPTLWTGNTFSSTLWRALWSRWGEHRARQTWQVCLYQQHQLIMITLPIQVQANSLIFLHIFHANILSICHVKLVLLQAERSYNL